MKLFISALFVAALGTGSAMAADLLLPASAEITLDDTAYDWSGIYAGGQIGYNFGRGVVDIPLLVQPTFGMDVNGVAGGVHIGANTQFDSFVVGVELGGNLMGANGRAPSGFGTEEYLIEQNWDVSLVGRAGVALDQVLLYGLAGASVTSLTTNYAPGGFPDATDTVWGWTIGAGAEYAISETLSAGLEYRYADYGLANFTHGGPSSVDLGTHAVKARLSYRF